MRRAVRAIVFRGNDVLVMKRNKFGKVYYTLLGGGVKFGETPEQALRREMQEESGLQLGAARLVFIENAGLIFGMQYVYLIDYAGGEPKLDASSDEARIDAMGKNRYHPEWLPVRQLADVPFVSKRLQRALLRALTTRFPAHAEGI